MLHCSCSEHRNGIEVAVLTQPGAALIQHNAALASKEVARRDNGGIDPTNAEKGKERQ